MDAAHRWTDEQLEALERHMDAEYKRAAREMREYQESMLKDYAREREARLKALDNTEEAQKAFEAWLQDQALRHEQVQAIVDRLSQEAVGANGRAIAATRDMIPVVYSENANMAAFEIDRMLGVNTLFDIVDESTVREIMERGAFGDPIIREVPYPKHDRPKDYRWNRQQFTSAITQGILQGESIPSIVRRTNAIFGKNEAAAVRAARTATTGAENAGRISSYRRATDDLGIPMVQEWVATLDDRTRDTHRELDGVQVEVGEPFHTENGDLRYPGDPVGPASEVYNCRCTIRGRVKGFEDARTERWSRLPEGTTYQDWKDGKDEEKKLGNPANEPQGKPKLHQQQEAEPMQKEQPQRLTNRQIDAMDRSQLEAKAREIFVRENTAKGLTEQEALERFSLLIDGNSVTDLRKYIKRWR